MMIDLQMYCDVGGNEVNLQEVAHLYKEHYVLSLYVALCLPCSTYISSNVIVKLFSLRLTIN